MDKLAFNAAATIDEQRLARQVLAHEMANVNTTGFKKSFEVSLKAYKADGNGFDSRFQPQIFHNDAIPMVQGALMATGRDLDIAMGDSTVLGVTSDSGALAFTRRGDLALSPSGVLQTATGNTVKAEGGGVITVPAGFSINIANDGQVYATDPAQPGVPQPVQIGQLLLRDASQTSLIRTRDGLFQPKDLPAGSDFANGTKPVSITSKALESSNVNAMETLVKLIEQSRSFETQVRTIKESQTVDEAGASMMKLGS